MNHSTEIALTFLRKSGLLIFLLTVFFPSIGQSFEDRSTLLQEAIALYADSNYEQAKGILLQVDSLAENGHVDSLAASAYYWLGRIGYVQRKGKEGVKWLEKAYDWFHAHPVDHAKLLFETCEWMGNIYRYTLGNPYQALPWFESAFDLLEHDSTIDSDGQRRMTYNLAATHRIMRDTDKAIVFGLKSLALAKQQNANQVQLASHLNLMGVIYVSDRQPDAAIPYFNEALSLISENERWRNRQFRYRSNLADAYREVGAFSLSQEVQQQNLREMLNLPEIDPYLLGITYFLLAKNARALEEELQLNQYLQLGLNTFKLNYEQLPAIASEIYSYSSWVNEYDPNRAVLLADSAIQVLWPNWTDKEVVSTLFTEKIDWEALFRAFGRMAKAQRLSALEKGIHLDKALHYHEQALATYQWYRTSFLRKRSIINQSEEYVWLLEEALETIDLAMKSGQSSWEMDELYNLSWRVIEMGKGFSLHQQFMEYQARTDELLPKAVYDEYRLLLSRQSSFERALQQDSLFWVQRKITEWHDKVAETYPAYRHYLKQTELSTINEIRNTISEGKTVINYWEGSNAIYMLSLDDQHTYFGSRKKELLDEDLTLFLDFLSHPFPESVTEKEAATAIKSGHRLYEQLIQSAGFNKASGLILIPHGQLESLSFGALLMHDAVKRPLDYRNYPYLIRNQSIQYAYSGAHWLSVRKHLSREWEVNPKMSGFAWGAQVGQRSLPALPASEKEVAQAVEHWGGNLYIAADAQEREFRRSLQIGDVLHVATHGVAASEEDPVLIFPVADQQHDGIFHLYELMDIDITVRLAVLNACETSDGDFRQGEGLASFARGFAWAGCQSVMSNLWPGYDESMSRLMQSWYQEIADGSALDVALQASMNDYLSESSPLEAHPSRWAGVVLIGETHLDHDAHNRWNIFYWILLVSLLCVGGFFLLWKRH